jgi:hypothetical protein
VQWRHLRNSGLLIALSAVLLGSVALPALAVTTVQSQVCDDFVAPAIVSPSNGTQTKDDSIMIEGTGEPGKTLAVLRDSVTQGVSTIAADGSFGFTVSLQQGDNTFIARESNECSTTKDSAPVLVQADIPVPVVPPVVDEPSGEQPPSTVPPGVDTTNQPFVPVKNSPGFQKPKITKPKSGVTVYLDTLLVEGTAQPNSLVVIYINGVSQAQLFSSKAGTYKVRIVLREGRNIINVRSTLAGKTATSDGVIVTYIKKVTSTLSRPLSTNEVITTVITAGAAVAGAASVVTIVHWSIHRYKFRFKRWK